MRYGEGEPEALGPGEAIGESVGAGEPAIGGALGVFDPGDPGEFGVLGVPG